MGRPTIYNHLFAKFYDLFMNGFEKGLIKNRKQLVSQLEGRVLEVGSGTGVNFGFYNSKAEVVALEPSAPMIKVSK
jgi:ubiquinone/menaquinone biosynthesis C-methylase UbiE